MIRFILSTLLSSFAATLILFAAIGFIFPDNFGVTVVLFLVAWPIAFVAVGVDALKS